MVQEGVPSDRRLSDWPAIMVILAFYALMAGIAVLWSALRGEPGLLLLSNQTSPGHFASLLIGILGGLVFALASLACSRWFAWTRRLEHEFARILGPLSIIQCLLIALASSVSEEAFFRGAMQPSIGLGLTSVIFGLLHVGPSRTFLPWTLMAIFMGFAFGWMFVWTSSLLAPIACHFTINAINLQRISIKARSQGERLS
jgi:uncharacterized protein